MTTLEGKPVPAFDMPTADGDRVSDGALKGQPYVLYFYPKADTPGCTTEGKDFSALMDDFAAAGARVIGVSKDTVRKLSNFKAKHDLTVTLASDEVESVCAAFGTWVEKSMYGRTYMGIERATFLVDAGGVVRKQWSRVKVKGHAEEVLQAVRDL
ncbi:peroxiredoxin [Brevundimonas sp.]|uniref:peroxiredoxin n=1 Tax=Brevundimonas sp. TaxID=1871086 RepID=UPI003511B943